MPNAGATSIGPVEASIERLSASIAAALAAGAVDLAATLAGSLAALTDELRSRRRAAAGVVDLADARRMPQE